MKYRKDVTDQEVKADFQRVFDSEIKHFLVPRVRPANTTSDPEPETDKPGQKRAARPGSKEDTGKSGIALNDNEKLLLESIFYRPNLPITKRTAMLGMSPYSMNKQKGDLLSKGLAEQFTINLGKEFGGNITLLALTGKGYLAIGKHPTHKKLKNESLEHWWWKDMIFRHYIGKKIPAEIEKSIVGSKHADVGIKHKGRDIAIEVELTPKNALTNIIQDLNSGFDHVLSCPKNRMVEKRIVSDFQSLSKYELLKDKVTFRLLSAFEFVRELKKP